MNFAAQLERRWVAGVLGGLALGTVLMFQVLSQPVSPRAQGTALVVQLLYYGVLYGTVDALLLSVLPVLVLYGARDASQLQRATGRLRFAGVALLGSALVTAAYHAGFAEFRGAGLVRPVIGNLVITLGYLLTGSPLGSIVAHVAMHSAAVLHGMEGTSQLPPHY